MQVHWHVKRSALFPKLGTVRKHDEYFFPILWVEKSGTIPVGNAEDYEAVVYRTQGSFVTSPAPSPPLTPLALPTPFQMLPSSSSSWASFLALSSPSSELCC